MAGFAKLVDMRRTPEEKAEARARDMFPPEIASMPDVDPGLCICLNEETLEKCDVDVDCLEVGDLIHVAGMMRITSKSVNETDNGQRVRIEACFVMFGMEDETTETEEEEEEE